MHFDSSSLAYILDFLAGVFIIFSIIFRSRRQIKTEAETLYDGNPIVYESQLNAFWHGWTGCGVLFAGTFLHLLHFEIEPRQFALTLTLILIILVVIKRVIKRSVEAEVQKRYPHYELVKKNMKDGKYDLPR